MKRYTQPHVTGANRPASTSITSAAEANSVGQHTKRNRSIVPAGQLCEMPRLGRLRWLS
jgi:hypothetical protein